MRQLREQIAQDEAYLAEKERDMQDVADVARARLENERQQKELGGETQSVSDRDLRETEEAAQAQESAAELAARKAAEAQDAAELERIAKQREYGFTMTSYFIEGYFDANKRVRMDIPTYDEAVRVAYGQGRFGWKFRKVDPQKGISDDVLREAYKEGRQKGEEHGTAGTGDGGERDAGMDSDEPSGRVGGGAGAAAKESAGGFGIKESLRIQSVLGTAKAERLSAKADGIQNGTDAKMFYRVPEETVQEYPALKQAKQILTDAGADDVRLVSGSIRIRTAGGREMSVQGVTQGTTVWLTIDAKDGVIKTAEHEAMHLRLEAEPGLRERLTGALGLSQEQRDKLARKYCEAYEGCYTGEDLSAYLDEIVCDAYAGINRMGLGADKLQNAVRTAADSTTSQSAKKPAQTRGPPEAYSINNTRGESVKEQFKQYRANGLTKHDEFYFGTLAREYDALGITGQPLVMSQTTYKKSKSEKHNVPQRVFNNLESIMQQPVLSFEIGNSVGVLTDEIDGDGKPLLVGVLKDAELDGETVTRIKSIYGLDNPKEWIANQIKEGKELRIYDNKKADSFLNGFGYKAGRAESYRLGDIVQSVEENVKGKYSPAASPKENDKTALAYFGKTYKWSETGYVLLDGSKLDFSGRHEGGSGGYRSVDHRDISDAFGGDFGDGSYTGGMVQFMQEGNIRISPESGGINLAVMPTKAQMDSLSDFISRERGEVILDIDDENGNTLSSTEYPKGTHANKVLQDIRNYFQSGQTPQVGSAPTVQQFRLSVAPSYEQEVQAWAKDGMPSDASFTLGTTGDVLQGLGAIESDIYMNGEKIRTILAEHPEMTLREIERIPEILDDPVMILKSRNVGRGNQQNSRLVIFGSLKAQNGKPVLSVLDLRPNENGFILTDMQKVTSAYTKDSNPMRYVQSSEVLFADKKRTIPLLRTLGFHMPSELQRSGSIGSISYKGQNVNLQGEKFSDVVKLGDSGKTTAKLSPEGRDANARQVGNNEPSPHQSAAPTASPQGNRGEAEGVQLRQAPGEGAGVCGSGGEQRGAAGGEHDEHSGQGKARGAEACCAGHDERVPENRQDRAGDDRQELCGRLRRRR